MCWVDIIRRGDVKGWAGDVSLVARNREAQLSRGVRFTRPAKLPRPATRAAAPAGAERERRKRMVGRVREGTSREGGVDWNGFCNVYSIMWIKRYSGNQ